MRPIKVLTRFCGILLLLGIAPRLAASADIDVRSVVLPTSEGPVTAALYAVREESHRPAVIILHGTQGIDRFRTFYQHYAAAIAGSGIDAYLLSYYNDDDIRQTKSQIVEERRVVFRKRIRNWSKLVSDVVSDILSGGSSGQIGVLGFSQGGFLAAAAAGQDARISALAVFYGGIPSALKDDITHLPPLLELHGDADRVVPLPEGKALVDLAHGLGQSAEMVVYPGAGHGFDGADAADAERRTIAFFQQRLLAAEH